MNKLSQKSVPFKVLNNITDNKLIKEGDTIIVAISGGPDSVCLLDVLDNLRGRLKINLLACHYNHRLRGEDSYNDEEFVKKICRDRGLECIIGSAPEKNLYKNEDSARNARYTFFKKILGERRGAKMAIAHNSNDLAETFVLRLLRGTGIFGLISIPLSRENFIRPLLYVSRDEIENYLFSRKISFRLDKTNEDPKITRNFVRLKLFPLIAKYINPNVVETLSNSVKLMEDDHDFLSKVAEEKYKQIVEQKNSQKISLDRKKWLALHPSLKRLVLRKAISELVGLTDITNKQIFEVCEMVERGAGKKFKILPHSLRIELVSGKINLLKKPSNENINA